MGSCFSEVAGKIARNIILCCVIHFLVKLKNYVLLSFPSMFYDLGLQRPFNIPSILVVFVCFNGVLMLTLIETISSHFVPQSESSVDAVEIPLANIFFLQDTHAAVQFCQLFCPVFLLQDNKWHLSASIMITFIIILFILVLSYFFHIILIYVCHNSSHHDHSDYISSSFSCSSSSSSSSSSS